MVIDPTDKDTVMPRATDEMRRRLDDLGDLRAQKTDMEETIKGVQSSLVETLKGNAIKSLSSDRYKGTMVTRTNVRIDEDRLKKEVGHKVWAKITTPTLDKEKLEAAIAMDLVDPNVVAKCSSTSESESIRVTQKKGK